MIPDARRKLGYDDLSGMPDDGLTREILDGELIVTPSPSPQHQRVSKRLLRRLEDYFEARGLGEVFAAPLDTILGPHDVVEPDVLVVADAASITKRAIERAPLLAVEILSPSTERIDKGKKRQRYAVGGVIHYWIVDIDRQQMLCLRLDGGVYEVVAEARGADVLSHPDWPDLAIDLAALWR
jgi:Uma2 family endonuclease